MRFVAFDIETDGLVEDDVPPGVTCCATRLTVGDETHVRTFHSNYASSMTTRDLADVVEYLYALHVAGVTVVTFNGAGFDFRVLALHLQDSPAHTALLAKMVPLHVDIMLEFACRYGYYASMASFCAGSGLPGKTGDGADAIGMWCGPEATLASRAAVLAYCANDVLCLARLYEHVSSTGAAVRVTKRSQRPQQVEFSSPPATVAGAIQRYREKPADVSWMDDPPDICKPVAWLNV